LGGVGFGVGLLGGLFPLLGPDGFPVLLGALVGAFFAIVFILYLIV